MDTERVGEGGGRDAGQSAAQHALERRQRLSIAHQPLNRTTISTPSAHNDTTHGHATHDARGEEGTLR
jgi:hypothetical protein